MPDFGVLSTGFVRKTQQDILAEIEADQLAEIGPLVSVSATQPLGQINGIISRQIGQVWEVAEAVYKSGDPDAAEGDALTSLAKLTGTERRPASYTLVDCEVVADVGTALVSGDAFAHLDGDPESRFTPEEDFTAPSTGTHTVRFRAEQTGPIECPVGQLTVIATPIVGWTSIINPDPATKGRDIDDDADLRERREGQLTASGSATVDAIAAALLELSNIESVTMFENTGDTIDSNGLPPHSFEALIHDNGANDDEIADIIWNEKPAGIRAFGSESGTATDDVGVTHTVGFSRVEPVDVYLDFVIVVNGDYVGDTEFKNTIASFCNDEYRYAGKDVIASKVRSFVFEMEGIEDVTDLDLDTSPTPSNEGNVPIGPRQLARFDASNITVTH